jgi:hypothetical protein
MAGTPAMKKKNWSLLKHVKQEGLDGTALSIMKSSFQYCGAIAEVRSTRSGAG